MRLIAGTYSNAASPGIYIYNMEASGGEFKIVASITGIENPSYLHVSDHRIYAISENKESADGLLSIYQFDGDQRPQLISRTAFEGAGSCFVTTDHMERHVFVANYGSGSLTVFDFMTDTGIAVLAQQIQFSGSGPVAGRQDQSHIHAAVLSKDERYLYCTDLGADRLYRFLYEPDKAAPLIADPVPYIQLPPGSGPRHLDFSADGRWIYLITELSGEIFWLDTLEWNTGGLECVSIVQQGYAGKIEGGDIRADESGQYLFASNRGDANEIIAYRINSQDGKLTFYQRIGAAGLSPRNLLVLSRYNLLLAANEQSNSISVFRFKPDGQLEYTSQHLNVCAPTCLKAFF
jgi:6-phosphogluconolactonase